MLNDPTITNATRHPRGIVQITVGTDTWMVRDWLEWEVDNNNLHRADTFRVRFALSALPQPMTASWWTEQQEIFVGIFEGFPLDVENYTEADLTQRIYGRADHIDHDLAGSTLEISGRDLTAQMIDTITTKKWQNLFSSQIAEQIATSHGLKFVGTATTTRAGKYYEIDHARIAHQQTEWDLLCWLAREENFAVWVRGQTLYFQPRPDQSSEPYVIRYQPPADEAYPISNAQSLHFSRDLTLARDVVVVVKSWNFKQKKAFSRKVTGEHAAGSPGAPQTYSFVVPNLTPEEALKRAQALLAEITAHEMRMSASLPGDSVLDVNCVIKVEGTGTNYDQVYYPDSVRRSMSITEGYRMQVSAKNHATESQVTL